MRSTKKRNVDFAKKKEYREQWYDLYEDWGLIEASFASQYGIRLRNETDMPWGEFCTLLAGILPDTPLGKMTNIRAENDKEVLKNFTKEQHKIRNEWRSRACKKIILNEDEAREQMRMFQDAMKIAFG